MEEIKIKLPRKRKKEYIKHLGANNYRGMRLSFLPMEGLRKFPREIVARPDSTGMPEFKTLRFW